MAAHVAQADIATGHVLGCFLRRGRGGAGAQSGWMPQRICARLCHFLLCIQLTLHSHTGC